MDKNIYIKDVLRECHGTLLQGDTERVIDSFSKDTRTLQKGDAYIGIKGENFDGNTLYKEAFEKGANTCILDKDTNVQDIEDYKVKAFNEIRQMVSKEDGVCPLYSEKDETKIKEAIKELEQLGEKHEIESHVDYFYKYPLVATTSTSTCTDRHWMELNNE